MSLRVRLYKICLEMSRLTADFSRLEGLKIFCFYPVYDYERNKYELLKYQGQSRKKNYIIRHFSSRDNEDHWFEYKEKDYGKNWILI